MGKKAEICNTQIQLSKTAPLRACLAEVLGGGSFYYPAPYLLLRETERALPSSPYGSPGTVTREFPRTGPSLVAHCLS